MSIYCRYPDVVPCSIPISTAIDKIEIKMAEPNISKKQKTYSEKVSDGQKLVALWFDADKWEQIKQAADSVQEPITTWIRRAVFASLRRWSIPESKVLFDPCSICGQRHNKAEHGE